MIEKLEGFKLADYQIAHRKMRMDEAKMSFKIHLAWYIVVNTILIAFNLLTNQIWFVFPLIGWGIGITMHYTYGVRRFEAQIKAEEAKVENIIKS
jgi:hypothetical protein